ncbi:MAG: TlpA disulfide reductase family protein [Pseudomonadota bacterium]
MRSLLICLLPLVLTACDRGSPDAVQANRTAAAAPVTAAEVAADPALPPPTGGVIVPDFSHRGEAPPAATLTDAAGKPVTLASFKGKPLLVNLWATWCAPCVAEMPTLDTLAVREAGKLQVVVVNQDSADNAPKVAAFFAERRFKALRDLRDPELQLSVAYAANLPTTLLYGSDGREVARVTGGMDWAGPDAAQLLAQAK